MNTPRWIILLVLLAAAFGAGHVVGSAGGEGAAPELATASGPEPSSEEAPGAVLHGSQGPTLAAPPSASASAAPLARALAELPALDVPRGDGRIDVIVKTDEGVGVQGVRVLCVPEMPKSLVRTWQGVPRDQVDSAELLLDYANRLRWGKEAAVEAVTDASGACSLEGLSPAKHSVRAQADGWQIRSASGSTSEVEPGSTVEFKAKPRTQVHIEVVMPDGSVPEKAQVTFSNGDDSRGGHWSPARPDVDAEVGTWDVSATAGDGDQFRSQAEQVTVEVGRPSPVVRLALVERTWLRTTVVPAEGEETTDVAVRHVRVPSGVRPDLALLGSPSESQYLRSEVGRAMAFTAYDVELGTWLVAAYRGWQGPLLASQVVEVAAGQNEVTLQLPVTPRADYALLRVRGPDGKPLAGLSFMTTFESDSGSMSSSGAAVAARSGGEYWVFHHPEGTTGQKGTCRITVEHRQLGKQLLSYAAGEAPTFDVRFEEPAKVEVTLEGLEGDRYTGRLTVQLYPDSSSKYPGMLGPTSAAVGGDGRATLDGVQPGHYLLNLQLTRGPWGGMGVTEERLSVHTGAQGVRLKVPALHVVEIEGVTAQAHIQRTDADTGRRAFLVVQPGADGRAIVDGLVAGDYQVRMGAKVTTFRLPGTSTVRIE